MVFTKEFTIAPQRSLRVEDELWEAARARASREDDTVSQVIRRFLTEYVKNDDASMNDATEDEDARVVILADTATVDDASADTSAVI